MSRSTVRAAVAQFLAPPVVPGLINVFRAAPTLIQGDDWAPIVDGLWGATAYVHIADANETRIAVGGAHGGVKRIDYSMALVLVFRWVIPDGAGLSDGAVDAWADAYDQLIEGIIARMRSDRTFGCGSNGPIWQAGEDVGDIRIQSDLPKIDAGQVIVWSALEFKAQEMIAS